MEHLSTLLLHVETLAGTHYVNQATPQSCQIQYRYQCSLATSLQLQEQNG